METLPTTLLTTPLEEMVFEAQAAELADMEMLKYVVSSPVWLATGANIGLHAMGYPLSALQVHRDVADTATHF